MSIFELNLKFNTEDGQLEEMSYLEIQDFLQKILDKEISNLNISIIEHSSSENGNRSDYLDDLIIY